MKSIFISILLVIGLNTFAQKFQLIELPYATNALEPVISQKTVEIHHGKHLKGYVDNLNKLVPGTKYEDMTLVEIVKNSDGTIFNNAGQIGRAHV